MLNLRNSINSLDPRCGETIFIAVDGHGGSGKSTFASWFSEQLKAEVIHTDDFAGWDNPLNWWPNVVEKIFKPIQAGGTFPSFQPASWWENHRPEPVVNQPVTPIMILEGVSASRKEFDEYLSYRVFVDTPKKICLARGIQRDRTTGKSDDELIKIWREWFEEEKNFFKNDDPKEKADLILDGTKPFEEQVTI